MVTYSQGGLIAAGWMRENNNAEIVDKVVNISGLLNGTPIGEVASYLPGNCLGIGTCQGFNPKGEFIGEITTPGALPGVEYLNIDSRTDILAGPYTNNLMTGAGEYQNVLTEDLCTGQFNAHMSLGGSLIVHEAIVQFFRGQEVAPSCIY